MVVGLCVLEVHLPGCRSLKEKRRVIKSLIDRLRGHFNLAVAELDFMDDWRRATLGLCTIANSTRFVDQVLAGAVQLVEAERRLVVSQIRTEKL